VSNQFTAWINEQIHARFNTATALARAIGVQLPVFLRGVEKGTFSIANLLRLAQATDTHPSDVLRLAGKGDIAKLIEELYQVDVLPVSAGEQRLLRRWRQLSPQAQHSLETIMRDLPKQRRPKHFSGKKSRKQDRKTQDVVVLRQSLPKRFARRRSA
jgi:hypothetical protein